MQTASDFQIRMKNVQSYICGGTSACFASALIHPIDLTKVRIQVYELPAGMTVKPGPVTIIKNIFKTEGPLALYSGLSAAILRQAIYGTARLGMHRSFSDALELRHGGPIPFYQKFGSGMLSGALAGMIGNPMDLSLVRMQADGSKPLAERRNYKNVFDAMFRTVREEGLMTLWRGSFPMICRAMAMNVGMLATYDQAKQMITEVNGDNFSTKLLSSAAAGFACAVTSLPFDFMKTRLMNMSPGADGKLPYSGLGDCFYKTLKNDGPLSFWRGFMTYYGRCAPHAMTILIVNEILNDKYSNVFGLNNVSF